MDKRTFDVNGFTFNMLPVEGGLFVMGATAEQHGDAYDNESPIHSVMLDGFYLGETVVTQSLWNAVMGETDEENLDMPVTGKSWTACQTFIRKLNDITGNVFRLPTEAEWEYAARGGRMKRGCKYAGSNNLDDVAWYEKNSGNMVHPVRQKQPNELGFYDMSGNVWEWCADYYGEYERSEEGEEEVVHNPQGPKSGSQHVVRGASYKYYAQSCRVSCRLPLDSMGNASTGFRLAMDVEQHHAQHEEGEAVAETPKVVPPVVKQRKSKPAGASKKSGKSGNGNYWGASGGGRRRKKKVWPWIVGPIGGVLGLFILFILIGILLKNGNNDSTSEADKSSQEAEAQQKVDTAMINQEITKLWNKFEDAIGNDKDKGDSDKSFYCYLKDYTEGIQILNEIKSKLRDYKKQLKHENGNEFDETIGRIDSLSQALDKRVIHIIEKQKVNIQGSSNSTTKADGEKAIRQLIEWKKTDGKLDIHDYVDLGLPSGTLWATCNLGANKPEDYGDYFAWGETQPKDNYAWSNYKYTKGDSNKLTKYCNNYRYGNNGYKDNLTTLEECDDPVVLHWGDAWHTPSKEQCDELLANTTNKWTTQKGVNGILFTSSENGQMLFLPAAGGFKNSGLLYPGDQGFYWSRSIGTDNSVPNAWSLRFSLNSCLMGGDGMRFTGVSVRPVREK